MNTQLSVHQSKKNHFLLLLDASSSMLNWDPRGRREYIEGSNAEKLIQVVDAEITRLADLADLHEPDLETGRPQEFRVSIAQFASQGEYRMLIWDMDPRTLPSVKELYQPHGNTAMCEAVNRGLEDLALVSEKYGDYAHLVYVFTDGEENDSDGRLSRTAWRTAYSGVARTQQDLMRQKLASLPDNVTVAAFVPSDPDGRHRFRNEAIRFGIPEHNVQEWDAQSEDGVFEVGRIVEQASTVWMENRAKGIKATRNLFSTGADAVNEQTIAQAELEPLAASAYKIFTVTEESQIRPFVEAQKITVKGKKQPLTYRTGMAFYELMKTETIQVQKALAIMDKETEEVFTGPEVRDMVGLGGDTVRVKPNHNPKYKIFVQSTSVNRKLLPGTNLLVML